MVFLNDSTMSLSTVEQLIRNASRGTQRIKMFHLKPFYVLTDYRMSRSSSSYTFSSLLQNNGG